MMDKEQYKKTFDTVASFGMEPLEVRRLMKNSRKHAYMNKIAAAAAVVAVLAGSTGWHTRQMSAASSAPFSSGFMAIRRMLSLSLMKKMCRRDRYGRLRLRPLHGDLERCIYPVRQ